MASTEPKAELDLDGITDENVLQQMVSCSFFFLFFFLSFFFGGGLIRPMILS